MNCAWDLRLPPDVNVAFQVLHRREKGQDKKVLQQDKQPRPQAPGVAAVVNSASLSQVQPVMPTRMLIS